MKTLLIAGLLLSLTCGRLATPACAQEVERAAPSTGQLAGSGIGASPLVRYLAATLHLSPQRTRVVQLAVQKHERRTRTPELLASYLAEVLTPEELDHFLTLQDEPLVASRPSLAWR